jgi:hypothetical protein
VNWRAGSAARTSRGDAPVARSTVGVAEATARSKEVGLVEPLAGGGGGRAVAGTGDAACDRWSCWGGALLTFEACVSEAATEPAALAVGAGSTFVTGATPSSLAPDAGGEALGADGAVMEA